MKSSGFYEELVRYSYRARTFLDAHCGKTLNKQNLSVTLECLALIIAWSAVSAMILAVAGFLLGEQ